jgi:hypothetical protein
MKNIHEAGAANSYNGILYSVEGRVGFGGTPMTDSARSFASPLSFTGVVAAVSSL